MNPILTLKYNLNLFKIKCLFLEIKGQLLILVMLLTDYCNFDFHNIFGTN